MVCFGTNKSREELARDGGLYASPELEHRVRDLVRRHLEGEPVAYLIGEWEFYGLPLDISRDVLIPRPDTEVLAEQAIGYIKTLGECRVLDLCAGSGCVGAGGVRQCARLPGGAGGAVGRSLAGVQAERPPQQPERPGHLCQRQCPGAPGLCPVGL